jgi:Succinylglutamate desuccinylase / Aspartoacylase family
MLWFVEVPLLTQPGCWQQLCLGATEATNTTIRMNDSRLTTPNTGPLIWQRSGGGFSNDLAQWRQQLEALTGADWVSEEFGPVLGEPLPLLRPRLSVTADVPRLLIACGFHGEEPAGPWGLLEFLKQWPVDGSVHLSLLPLVNATGFAAGTRFNRELQNPNRGFMPDLFPEDLLSVEGQLLVQRGALLQDLARDGILSCHEDSGVATTYVYCYEPALTEPGGFSRALRDTAANHFALHPDGTVDGCVIREGIVFNQWDGSFEAWLGSRGAAVAACIETPGQQAFEDRVQAQAALMRSFVSQRQEVLCTSRFAPSARGTVSKGRPRSQV